MPARISYVYIASPYSIGNKEDNVKRSMIAANALMAEGFIPFCPLLSHYWQEFSPKADDEWLALDFAWLKRCDAVLRLPGESYGADKEVTLAKAMDIPVFTTIKEILQTKYEW